MLSCTRINRAMKGGGGGVGSRQYSNAARSKFLQGTSASFSFFITRELKIETGLDRDPEIDRGHHSYKRHTIQEYSVCTVWRTGKPELILWRNRLLFLSLFLNFFFKFVVLLVFWKEAPVLQWVSCGNLSLASLFPSGYCYIYISVLIFLNFTLFIPLQNVKVNVADWLRRDVCGKKRGVMSVSKQSVFAAKRESPSVLIIKKGGCVLLLYCS